MKSKKNINKPDLSKLAFSVLEKNQVKVKNERYNNEELLDSYVGNNYEKISKRFINFSALFLGPIYYLYRKLYILGIISLIIQTLFVALIKDVKYLTIMCVSFQVFLSLFFNFIYIAISKKKIKRIINKNEKDNIKELCILKGGTSILNVSLIMVVYIITIILFFSAPVIKFFTGIFKKDESVKIIEVNKEYNDFIDMIESYSITAKQNIGNPTLYKYIINDEEYNFIALPVAEDDENIYCSKKSKKDIWKNKEGFTVKENSTECEEFMDDILKNYYKFYNIKLPTKGEIVLSKDGNVLDGTTLKFDNVTCDYNQKIKKLECK